MKLLIIGGTRFLGRHLVTAALKHNHEITLFNRGHHLSEPQPDVELVIGDRKHDLAKLQGHSWDTVIDTCGYLPHTVKSAAALLCNSIDSYVFMSSQSVYSDVSVIGVDETAPLATLTNEQLQEADEIDSSGQTSAPSYGKLYGGLKAVCEQTLEEVLPHRALIIRPGLIVGPYDYTDRFTYWVQRVARGNEEREVLAPGRPEKNVQFIDVRDLAQWTIRMIETKATGIYNASGLPACLTMETVLQECKAVTGSEAYFTWVDETFLLKEKVAAWSDMPLWLPEDAAPHLKGFMFIRSDKAIASGLTFRSLRNTIADTLTWYQTNRLQEELKAGIEIEREQTLLRKWHRSASTNQ
jgi:nucleoside-diphosphate-sugar epimerase